MRDYAKVSPLFWTGSTGRRIRAHGPEAITVALYLMTNPHANALGLYYLPQLYIAHETGIPLEAPSEPLESPFEGVKKAMQALEEVGFCSYDPDSEVVWVFEMAKYQIGPSLKASDNRAKWVAEEYEGLPKCAFLKDFFDKYGQDYHLRAPRENKPLRRVSEAPSKPLRSQEMEIEQEQEEWRERDAREGGLVAMPVAFQEFWEAYPRKIAPAEALKEWQRLGRQIPDTLSLLDLLRRQIESEDWQREGGRWIPSPAKWLREKRWMDQPMSRASPGTQVGALRATTVAQAQIASRTAMAAEVIRSREEQHGTQGDAGAGEGSAFKPRVPLPV